VREVNIVWQDEHLLVVDKPAGVLVVQAPGRRAPTVVDLAGSQLGQTLFPVHRLDEDTTGALVIARTPAARAGMEALFEKHDLERSYLALVTGTPNPRAGRIESQLLERDGRVEVVARGGQKAITDYEVLDRRGRGALVRCTLHTGRRNQIRAHLAALGCPVAGDRKYGWRARGNEHPSRVLLHSWRIAFRHPVTGADVRVEVEPPEAELRP